MPSIARRAERNTNLRRALLTSLVARLAGILLQVLSLPLAAAALGPQGFSVYSMIGAILAWLSLSNLGIGPATTLHMAREPNVESREKIFSASWAIVIVLSSGVFFLLAGLVIFTPLVARIFASYATDMRQIYGALALVGFVFLVSQNLSIFESAQLAAQRQDKLNKATAAGTCVAAVFVYIVAKHDATVVNILLAVHLPVLFARSINAFITWREINGRNFGFIKIKTADAMHLFKDGMSFVSGTAISNFLCHPFAILAIGATAGALFTASLSAVMNAVILAASVFGLLTAPLQGALPEAARNGDKFWIWRAYKRVSYISLAYALVPGVLISVSGRQLFSFWYQGVIVPDEMLLIPAGIYIICLAVEVTNFNFLSSLGQVHQASGWLLAKSIVTAALVLVLAHYDHSKFVFLALVVVNLLFSALPLGALIRRLYREASEVSHG